eukprot:scaffold17289_cov67-Phaeocystis_antarctica.AAC.2
MGVGCHLAHDFDGGGELGAAACRCISTPATLGQLQEPAGPGRGDCDRSMGPWDRWRDRRPGGGILTRKWPTLFRVDDLPLRHVG